ncbi:MAG: hypothetical protein ACE5G2_07940 [Candidatus Krumholzibacteriia bacterium]
MRFESGSSTASPRPIDVYLGFEIFEEEEGGFVAVPQGWADGGGKELEASDLPALRKRIWHWWHDLLD